MKASLVRHIESYGHGELIAYQRELQRLRVELLCHASHRNMSFPRQRLALQCGVLAGFVSIAAGASLLVCLGATLTVVGLVLRYSSRPANRSDWMLALMASLDLPVGGYMEIYRHPEVLCHPYPEDALAHCTAQELMLIQLLLEKKSASTAFPA